jgi:hypothetical protein
MSHQSQQLLANLKSHMSNPAQSARGYLGDRSDLAQLLCLPGSEFSADDARTAVRLLITKQPALSLDNAAVALLNGLQAVLTALPLCQKDDGRAASSLQEAIEHFDNAFGLDGKQRQPEAPSGDKTAPHPVDRAFAQIGEFECGTRAWFMAYDLLSDWLTATSADKSTAYQPRLRMRPRSASISILGAVASGLFRLEIDLFPGVNGTFDPDPKSLGLTCIRLDSDEKHCLLRSMDGIWQRSQLSGAWRGRWRIVHPPNDARPKGSPISYPRQFRGRSAEAATLCALLGASGDPYRVGQTQSRLDPPIDIKMAISATVQAPSIDSQNPVLGSQLGPVEGINEKMAAAYPVIDTVVFAPKEVLRRPDQPQESFLTEIDELQQKEKQAQQNKSVYDGMRIAEAKTIVEALDLVLLTNRHLHAYHQEQRRGWLKKWIGGTGISQEFDPDQSVPPKE